MDDLRTAVRIDAATGVREEMIFFGDRSPRMFCGLHLPPGEVRAAVISCPSVHAELIKAYRKDVLLGRTLAAAGIATIRFHYRGEGNSEGSGLELNLDDMIASVDEARAEIARRTGAVRFGYHGTRLGTFPATAATEADPGAPLVLWAPLLDTDAFLREVFRTHYIAALKGEEKPEPTERMIERVKEEGQIELLGHAISREFYLSLEGRRLDAYRPKGSAVMLTPYGPQNLDELAAVWETAGADVTVFEGSSEEAWWLAGDATTPEDGQERVMTLVESTAIWLTEHLTG